MSEIKIDPNCTGKLSCSKLQGSFNSGSCLLASVFLSKHTVAEPTASDLACKSQVFNNEINMFGLKYPMRGVMVFSATCVPQPLDLLLFFRNAIFIQQFLDVLFYRFLILFRYIGRDQGHPVVGPLVAVIGGYQALCIASGIL